jgi:Sec-independent protein translocase protein TatA
VTLGYHPRMPDLIIILVVILIAAIVWRGPKTLPKLGEALGRGVKEAKAGAAATQEEIQARTTSSTDETDPPA